MEIQDAFEDFFDDYELEDVNAILWQMVRNAMGHEGSLAHTRVCIMDLYHDLGKLLTSIHTYHKKGKIKAKSKFSPSAKNGK